VSYSVGVRQRSDRRVRVRVHPPVHRHHVETAAGLDGWPLYLMWMRVRWSSRLHC
jgi:hypothetical protein